MAASCGYNPPVSDEQQSNPAYEKAERQSSPALRCTDRTIDPDQHKTRTRRSKGTPEGPPCTDLSSDQLIELYRQMLLVRRFEEKSAEAYVAGKIGGFCHLYIGQEAVAVGAISAIRKDDYVLTSYREHGLRLAKGMSARSVMAELFGKATGCSKGKGGSMHMFDKSSASLAAMQSSAAKFL